MVCLVIMFFFWRDLIFQVPLMDFGALIFFMICLCKVNCFLLTMVNHHCFQASNSRKSRLLNFGDVNPGCLGSCCFWVDQIQDGPNEICFID